MDWKEIEDLVTEASDSGDPILSRVRDLRLEINHFSMWLSDPYELTVDSSDDEDDNDVDDDDNVGKPVLVELDLDLSAQVSS